MKIKKEYTYSNKRQIWRLLPTSTEKLIIEDRDIQSKEVFFNCVDINSGKKIFLNFQLDEKFWIGIEAISEDIIIFHKFAKPDMPGHSSIIAFDIFSKKILWQNDDLVFLFISDKKLYAYKQKFEGRTFFSLNISDGKIVDEFVNNSDEINSSREKNFEAENKFTNYYFPETFDPNTYSNEAAEFINEFKIENVVTGKIDCVELKKVFLFNCHSVLMDGKLQNMFYAVDIEMKKIIFKEILDRETPVFIPDSFFVKDNLIFMIIDKLKLLVCKIED